MGGEEKNKQKCQSRNLILDYTLILFFAIKI
jgi:hypothetical protein